MGRVEDVDTLELDLDPAVVAMPDLDIRLAEDDEEIAASALPQLVGHVRIRVHPRLDDRHLAELLEVAGMGVEIEGAGDDHVEARVARLLRSLDQVHA